MTVINKVASCRGVLMPEEYLLKRFHDWVRDQLPTKDSA